MTRTYAAKRLLEHGPLTFREVMEITGWPWSAVKTTLSSLIDTGVAAYVGRRSGKRLYGIAD